MAATAGTVNFISAKSGRSIVVSAYVPDAAATQFTFNPTGAAASGSPTTYRVPEDVYYTGMDLLAAPTATVGILQVNGAIVAGGMSQHSANLVALATRQKFAIPIKAGDFVSILQA